MSVGSSSEESAAGPAPTPRWWQAHPVLARVLSWIAELFVLALGDGR